MPTCDNRKIKSTFDIVAIDIYMAEISKFQMCIVSSAIAYFLFLQTKERKVINIIPFTNHFLRTLPAAGGNTIKLMNISTRVLLSTLGPHVFLWARKPVRVL